MTNKLVVDWIWCCLLRVQVQRWAVQTPSTSLYCWLDRSLNMTYRLSGRASVGQSSSAGFKITNICLIVLVNIHKFHLEYLFFILHNLNDYLIFILQPTWLQVGAKSSSGLTYYSAESCLVQPQPVEYVNTIRNEYWPVFALLIKEKNGLNSRKKSCINTTMYFFWYAFSF